MVSPTSVVRSRIISVTMHDRILSIKSVGVRVLRPQNPHREVWDVAPTVTLARDAPPAPPRARGQPPRRADGPSPVSRPGALPPMQSLRSSAVPLRTLDVSQHGQRRAQGWVRRPEPVSKLVSARSADRVRFLPSLERALHCNVVVGNDDAATSEVDHALHAVDGLGSLIGSRAIAAVGVVHVAAGGKRRRVQRAPVLCPRSRRGTARRRW